MEKKLLMKVDFDLHSFDEENFAQMIKSMKAINKSELRGMIKDSIIRNELLIIPDFENSEKDWLVGVRIGFEYGEVYWIKGFRSVS